MTVKGSHAVIWTGLSELAGEDFFHKNDDTVIKQRFEA